ncbi:MAG: transporter [Gemmatimonadales bacterium]|nr:transporter [Gemmatimonadales bacterium]
MSRAAAALLLLLLPRALAAVQEEPIRDNSFLIEEAYNQDAGVVQHISTFSRSPGGAWAASFTQEWPWRGLADQLSYTVPLQREGTTGFGDILLNYRRQAVGSGGTMLAMAPRLSLLLPTGSVRAGRGRGGVGLQAALPVNLQFSSRFTAVLNAGGTWIPRARDRREHVAASLAGFAGGSVIWSAHPRLNLLVEGLWTRTGEVIGDGRTRGRSEAWLNPGVRWAFNGASGWQVVPGVAYTVGLGPSEGEEALFLYLSVEHAFRRR